MNNKLKYEYIVADNKLVIRIPDDMRGQVVEADIRSDIMAELVFIDQIEFVYVRSIDMGKIEMEAPPEIKRAPKTQSIGSDNVIVGSKIKVNPVRLEEVQMGKLTSCVLYLSDLNTWQLKSGKVIARLMLTDKIGGLSGKVFLKNSKDMEIFVNRMEIGSRYLIYGRLDFDKYENSNIFNINSINSYDIDDVRRDKADRKRVELHFHSNMSEQDGLSPVSSIIDRAIRWGHEAVAITDHGSVQAFSDMYEYSKDKPIKIIYGMEGYLVDDIRPFGYQPDDLKLDDEYIVFDIETTGLSARNDKLIEIGAVKVRGCEIIDSFQTFVDPEMELSDFTTELTSITTDMVVGAPKAEQAIMEFMDFCGEGFLVAHNSDFDMSFLNKHLDDFGSPRRMALDTIRLARQLLPIKRFGLDKVSRYFGINLIGHHRADQDAAATAQIFIILVNMIKELGITTMGEAREHFRKNYNSQTVFPTHITLLLKGQKHLMDFYKMISRSYLEDYGGVPKIRKSYLLDISEGILAGSSNDYGELFNSILMFKTEEEQLEIARSLNFIELICSANFAKLYNDGTLSGSDQLREINIRLLEIADELGIPAVATSDAHFIDPDEELARNMIIHGKLRRGMEYESPCYYRTTDEMLEEFRYLGDRVEEIVIDNSLKISKMTNQIIPVPQDKFPTKLEGADEDLKRICFEKARSLYGQALPPSFEARLARELQSIIGNGYAPMYMISNLMVKKSIEDGYSVGSRGSVGSSVAAFLGGVSDVNPLPAHYFCPNCQNTEIVDTPLVGVDLPPEKCPICGSDYSRDGYDIPFEAFLGFKGDKEPDIDLNFASVYQYKAQKYCEKLFGQGHTFKAGTIGTYASKTAYANVMKYDEDHGIERHPAAISWYKNMILGVKKSSGQHPAGILVLPKGYDINFFTPVQYAKNDAEAGIITTHFDYNMLSGRLLKLDVLGHEGPTMLRMLQDFTGLDHRNISINDSDTLSIFSNSKKLGIESSPQTPGTLGIPEFGTPFVMGMLSEVKPKTVSDLVRISGLSHGTDVWLNNARDLVMRGDVAFNEVIATREDIMNMLIAKGSDPQTAFWIMENVRKGKGLKPEELDELNRVSMPEWYINSCLKIKYLFPKAHAAAYVMQSLKIAYFKVHYPIAFYATYFSINIADFDAEGILAGKDETHKKIKQLESLPKLSAKDSNKLDFLKIAREMFERGIEINNVDLKHSHASKFKIVDNKILPPIQAIPDVGENAARQIYEASKKYDNFLSIEDFKEKTGANKSAIESMKQIGLFGNLSETNQLSFF